MSLNIKNPRTHDLVRELARRTGQSQTGAVEAAVSRMLDELGPHDAEPTRASRLAAARALVTAYRADLTAAERQRIRSADGLLYDDAGLPR